MGDWYARAEEEAQKFVDDLACCIKTAQVKTASASRNGNKVQVRITWLEKGKQKLGYFSLDTVVIKQGVGIRQVPFVQEVFRLKERIEKTIHGSDTRECADELMQKWPQEVVAKLAELRKQSIEKMLDVVKQGAANRVRHSANQAKCRRALRAWLCHALKNGIGHEEIETMLKEAVVEVTMTA